jgi:3-phenylpropionate/trans-cinnamate dioxygenase ferredoxin reductase subunit
MNAGLVIVGASYAGMQIAASAREAGYAEPIRIIGEEASLPYQRPPLSKGFLAGKVDASSLPLRAEGFYRENRIDLELGRRAERIELASKCVATVDGGRIRYERLALAVGSRARKLQIPGAELDGILSLRSLADAYQLKERIADARSIVIVGGGFIGLEIASILAPLGKEVTVVEAEDRLLARVTARPLSEFLADIHHKKGVRLLLRQTVSGLRGEDGRVRAAICADGTMLSADLVIVGVGAVPNCEIAQAAGLGCSNGILVDESTRTTVSDVVAAGDCTSHPSRLTGGRLRLESVQNALDQARVAGAVVAGVGKAYDTVPWFWSDQYELKLQMAGLSAGYDRSVIRGSIEEARFSVFYFRDERLIAVDSVNSAADYMLGRKIIGAGLPLTPEEAEDSQFDLRTIRPRRAA